MECEAFLYTHKTRLLLTLPKRLSSKCLFADPLGFQLQSDCYAKLQAGTRRLWYLLRVLPCRTPWQRESQLFWIGRGSQPSLMVRRPASVDWQLLTHLSDPVTDSVCSFCRPRRLALD